MAASIRAPSGSVVLGWKKNIYLYIFSFHGVPDGSPDLRHLRRERECEYEVARLRMGRAEGERSPHDWVTVAVAVHSFLSQQKTASMGVKQFNLFFILFWGYPVNHLGSAQRCSSPHAMQAM